ncbi:SDR family oxidoreductase [Geodermatophilus sp. SYSU D00691]
MTTTLVTGATGTLGVPTVARLRAAGHDVRALSRRSGPGLVTGDLVSGDGLDAALDGVDVVLHLSHSPRTKGGDTAQARTLLAASARAGVRHLVYVSIVGVDAIPLAYYRAKWEVERMVEQSGLPSTILRATQFHPFVTSMFTAQRRLPLLVVPTIDLQPIDVGEVADRLVELASGAPAGRVADIGGPEQRSLPSLARAWARSAGVRRPVVPLSLPGKLFAAYRSGAAMVPGPAYGRVSYEQWLAGRAEALR